MRFKITVILAPQPEGGYTVTCDELPGLVTEGDSVDEALKNVEDAFATTLELYEDLGLSLPEGIQVIDEEVPSIQTVTPRLKSRPPVNQDVPVENSHLWVSKDNHWIRIHDLMLYEIPKVYKKVKSTRLS